MFIFDGVFWFLVVLFCFKLFVYIVLFSLINILKINGYIEWMKFYLIEYFGKCLSMIFSEVKWEDINDVKKKCIEIVVKVFWFWVNFVVWIILFYFSGYILEWWFFFDVFYLRLMVMLSVIKFYW